MNIQEQYEDELPQIGWDDHEDFYGVIVAEVFDSHKYDAYYFSILQHYDSGKFYRVEWCAAYDGPSHSHSIFEVKPVCEVVTIWKEVKSDSV
jgi:hypothetical protein